MQVDDDLCLCFHVSWRKVLNYIRIHRVKVPSQLSECRYRLRMVPRSHDSLG